MMTISNMRFGSQFIRSLLIMFAIFALIIQMASNALAQSPLANNPLTLDVKAELDRRSDNMNNDKQKIQNLNSANVGSSLVTSIDKVLDTINTRKQSLSNVATKDELVKVAGDVDSDYPEYRAVDIAAKLFVDLKLQDKSIKQLRDVATQIKNTLNAAVSNGATHVNAGVAGFILLRLVDESTDKLKKNLTSTAIINAALSSTMELFTDEDDITDSTTAATFTQLYDQLSATKSTLQDVALGLSQLSNVMTGNRTGISYCGWWSNCRGLENNGAILICGVASDCSDSENNGNYMRCGFGSDCSDSENNGGTQVCGILSNCEDSKNTGNSQTCGILSNCANSTNNGLFVNCGIASICAGSKSNGLVQNCGILSYCANRENNGLNQNCGSLSNCQNNINKGIEQQCGILSNCSHSQNTGIVQSCGAVSNCSSSVNDGVAITCGILSDCSRSENNAGVITCGSASNCSGSTNNSLLIVCGILSNCSNSNTTSFVSICGTGSDCSGGSTNSFVQICGILSNCSRTIKECVAPATTASAETTLRLPLGLRGAV